MHPVEQDVVHESEIAIHADAGIAAGVARPEIVMKRAVQSANRAAERVVIGVQAFAENGILDGDVDGGQLEFLAAVRRLIHVAIHRHRELAPSAGTVVGMSAGGLTAIAVSTLAPDLVRRLVLVDILPEPDPTAASSIVDFLDGPDSFASFDDILARTVAFNPHRSVTSLRRGILHNAVQLPDGSWQWRHRRLRRGVQPTDSAEAAAMTQQLWASLDALAVPLLVVRGGADGTVVTDAQVVRLCAALPRTVVEKVDGAGHSVQGDQPVALAEIIDRFAAAGAGPAAGAVQ